MEIILIRHGETLWNASQRWQGQTDIPLSETGMVQAEAAGIKLANYTLDKIYTSPLQRAYKTAEIINTYIKVPLVPRDDLMEISLGRWEGFTVEQIKEQSAEEFKQWESGGCTYPAPGGESYLQVQQRAYRALCEIAKLGGNSVLICSHGAWIRALLCKLLHISLEERLIFSTHNTGISIVEYKEEKEQFHVLTVNDYSHIKF